MFSQAIGLAVDIGLGALALSLVRALKANVGAVKELTEKLVVGQEDHERRITALEGLKRLDQVEEEIRAANRR